MAELTQAKIDGELYKLAIEEELTDAEIIQANIRKCFRAWTGLQDFAFLTMQTVTNNGVTRSRRM